MARTLLTLAIAGVLVSLATPPSWAGGPPCKSCDQPRGLLHSFGHHKRGSGDPPAPPNPAGPPPFHEALQNLRPHGETAGRAPDPQPVTPMPAMTLWRFLGVPQALNGLSRRRDARTNADGTEPWKERKPPLLPLSAEANLESGNPAIKMAAEIKAEEDLAQQKIKAIRYLAMIGCGCYRGVDEALLAALDDCTEEVRYEAAKAIAASAKGGCRNCGQNACCNKEIHEKLMKIVYDMDDRGCPVEPSARVRAAAARALCACPPPPPTVISEDPPPVPSPEPVESPEPVANGIQSTPALTSPRASTGPSLKQPASAERVTSRRPANGVTPVQHSETLDWDPAVDGQSTTVRYPATNAPADKYQLFAND